MGYSCGKFFETHDACSLQATTKNCIVGENFSFLMKCSMVIERVK